MGITNIILNLVLNGYTQEVTDSIMKPRKNSHSLFRQNISCQNRYLIFEKFGLIVNQFNVRTISKTKHALSATLIKTGPVRGAQQMKQCVYNIPSDCGRCYIGEAGTLLEVRIKEHKYIT